jgi:hypothetical protein
VTDRLAWEILSAAEREKLLFVRDSSEPRPQAQLQSVGQRALSLLVLFDRLAIHELGDGNFRLPDLESEGIVEIVTASQPTDKIRALETKKRKVRMGPCRRLSKMHLEALSRLQQFRPLVINRLDSVENKFFAALANGLRVSKRRCLELFLDYAVAYVQGDGAALRTHLFSKVLPKDLLRDVRKELFDFSARGEDYLGPDNEVLVMGMIFANEIAIIQELSARLKLGVATEHYGERFRSDLALRGQQLDAVAAANRFLILRAAFADEGGFMPRINGIRHALSLRKDPHLKAVREQLRIFHGGLTTGDRLAIIEARREIQKARKRLESRVGWDKALRWLAYLSVPVGIVEILNGSPPIVGTSLSAVGAGGIAKSRQVERNNEWVLFGT